MEPPHLGQAWNGDYRLLQGVSGLGMVSRDIDLVRQAKAITGIWSHKGRRTLSWTRKRMEMLRGKQSLLVIGKGKKVQKNLLFFWLLSYTVPSAAFRLAQHYTVH